MIFTTSVIKLRLIIKGRKKMASIRGHLILLSVTGMSFIKSVLELTTGIYRQV